ncbi:helix-turn-helix transcriptional regulator [Ruminococcus sp.]|uniref:helix-turn-helix domain-containing protein n=1 Tax=Ruminococcus sp. TaxID=41978 RepID=UPI001B6600F4|nr:helix-turn-helix transcriptional regulator [Ruminococcus sp.]MBP5433624.1 helix-turn-helix transcriptional regulator [Ruminococcus sp.]
MSWKKEHEAMLKEIGQKLCELRKEQGMSQLDLAVEADLSQTFISRLERGAANPTVQSLQRIAHILGRKITIDII